MIRPPIPNIKIGEIRLLFVSNSLEIFNLFNNKLCNHLCKSCKNCRPSKCQKVRDIGDDKKIEKYDYLAIGVETDNMKDYYDSFVVKACIGFIPY